MILLFQIVPQQATTTSAYQFAKNYVEKNPVYLSQNIDPAARQLLESPAGFTQPIAMQTSVLEGVLLVINDPRLTEQQKALLEEIKIGLTSGVDPNIAAGQLVNSSLQLGGVSQVEFVNNIIRGVNKADKFNPETDITKDSERSYITHGVNQYSTGKTTNGQDLFDEPGVQKFVASITKEAIRSGELREPPKKPAKGSSLEDQKQYQQDMKYWYQERNQICENVRLTYQENKGGENSWVNQNSSFLTLKYGDSNTSQPIADNNKASALPEQKRPPAESAITHNATTPQTTTTDVASGAL